MTSTRTPVLLSSLPRRVFPSALAWLVPSATTRNHHRRIHKLTEDSVSRIQQQSWTSSSKQLHHKNLIRAATASPATSSWRLASSASSIPTEGCTNTTTEDATANLRIPPNDRAILLNRCLDAILTTTTSSSGHDDPSTSPSIDLMEAALRSIADPASGYDPRYGRPALRAYRSFVYPKKDLPFAEEDDLRLKAAAQRQANQIDFLVKRQASQQAQAVRNHDAVDPSTGNHTATPRFPITLVLDNLRGSFNVGSLFRTAEATGVAEILTCGITPHPHGSGADKVRKSALGADVLVPTRHFGTTTQALEALKATTGHGLPPLVVALETTSVSQVYTDVDFRPYYDANHTHDDNEATTTTSTDINHRSTTHSGIALVLGNEVTGVDVELLKPLLEKDDESKKDDDHGTTSNANSQPKPLVDALVELPVHGQKNSLNVAAVAPVVLYEILRQWTAT